MLSFVIENIFLLCFGFILFLVIRTLPRIEEPKEERQKNLLERWVTSGVPEKLDVLLNAFLAKILRKSKVLVLRVDNFVNNGLKKIVRENEAGKNKPDFKDVGGEKKPGEEI